MPNQITLLGTKGGPAVRQVGAMPTSSLLHLADKTIVIDCGIGVTRSLVEAGASLLDIDAIFITHLHSDHSLELGPLLYTAWTTGLSRKVQIFGPPGTEDYWNNFLKAMDFDLTIRLSDEGRPSIVDLVEVDIFGEGHVTRIGDVNVTALRVDHPPVTDCFALKFVGADNTVVFSADTCYFPPLADFAQGADVLVHEAMLSAGIDNLIKRTPGANRLREHLTASHTLAADAARIAADAKAKTLCLNHLVPADDPDLGEADWLSEVNKNWHGETKIGRDGMVIPLN